MGICSMIAETLSGYHTSGEVILESATAPGNFPKVQHNLGKKPSCVLCWYTGDLGDASTDLGTHTFAFIWSTPEFFYKNMLRDNDFASAIAKESYPWHSDRRLLSICFETRDTSLSCVAATYGAIDETVFRFRYASNSYSLLPGTYRWKAFA